MTPSAPEIALEVSLESAGTKAFLVIGRTVRNSSWGGLRIVPDPSMEETIATARTMTLKYGFVDLSIGGAKGALQWTNEHTSSRPEVLRELGEKLSHLLQSKRWQPGIGLGHSVEDIKNLYRRSIGEIAAENALRRVDIAENSVRRAFDDPGRSYFRSFPTCSVDRRFIGTLLWSYFRA